MIRKLLFVFGMLSVIESYAMNESCCSLIADQLTKMFENPYLAVIHKERLECDYKLYSNIRLQLPIKENSERLALAAWKMDRFNKLYEFHSCHHAKELLNEEITQKKYEQDLDYKKWVWDKTLISPVAEKINTALILWQAARLNELRREKCTHKQAIKNIQKELLAGLYEQHPEFQRVMSEYKKED